MSARTTAGAVVEALLACVNVNPPLRDDALSHVARPAEERLEEQRDEKREACEDDDAACTKGGDWCSPPERAAAEGDVGTMHDA